VVYESTPSYFPDSPVIVQSATDRAFHNGLWAARLEAATIAGMAAYAYGEFTTERDDDGGDYALREDVVDYPRELRDTRALMRELKEELENVADPLVAAIEKPVNGEYGGETAEDDAGDQSVSTTLSFGRDGAISGRGHDGVDGAYTIREGRWSGKRVAWVEEYEEGFTVALRGQVRPDGTILGLWASSRGVGGSVALQPPR